MSKPWVAGAWAADAEREEAEEKERAASASAPSMEAFPTLGESVAVKSKKKKPQTFTLAELTIGTSVAPGSRLRPMSDSRGLTPEEMRMLPTGPRDRSGEEEARGGLGGAFRDYRDYNRLDREQSRAGYAGGGAFEGDREGGSGGFLRDRERDEPSRADDSSDWSSSKKSAYPGGHDDQRRGFSGTREPLPPSRAEDVGNWGLAKKAFHPDAGLGGRREYFEHSRAEEADNWASVKKPLPPRPVAHDVASSSSRADETDNWSSVKKTTSVHVPDVQDMADDKRWGRRKELDDVEEAQRKPLMIAPPRSRQESPNRQGGSAADSVGLSEPEMAKSKPNPFGTARPREDVLAGRMVDLHRPKGDSMLTDQDSQPSTSHSSRHETVDSTEKPLVQARPKVNPFGNAKPREMTLQERGKDWRKMDFEYEHRGVERFSLKANAIGQVNLGFLLESSRLETEEESSLKEEIKRLSELGGMDKESGGQPMNGVVVCQDADTQNVLEELKKKERQLQDLTRFLDDQVRFSQKIGDRPSSRSGRSDTGRSYESSERPGSRPGSRTGSRPGSRSGRSDVGRNYNSTERSSSQSGRKNFGSSESSRSHTGYGGRNVDTGDRWSRPAQLEGNRNLEGLDRKSSWGGSSDSGRSFDSLQRSRRHPATLPAEVGGAPDYSQQGGGPDIWTRGNDRQGGWTEREPAGRAGRRRF